VKNKIK